jgi:NADPH-dependent 2,4-dienoyl-CoA reductase/sulfur reductase-like enzyme/nitrite reductase/ring-hydroxylating ferredoxin subunit
MVVNMKKNEIKIARTSDLQNGEMKMIETEEGTSVLLLKIDNHFYATDAHCPHYGAPLELGIVSEKKIICPWHHAMFDVSSGNLCEPPALEGIHRYQLEIRDNDIFLFPENKIDDKSQDKQKSITAKSDSPVYIIIGGGAAGNSAARTLRESGFEGRISIVSADSQLPYDRTSLSKDFLSGNMDPEWLPLNHADFFEQNDIDFIMNATVTGIDIKDKEIELEDQSKLKYDKLLVASGSRPRMPDIPGHTLKNIFTLRTHADAKSILERVKNTEKIAIIGASFIGLETADNLINDNREVHVIAPESLPLASTFGENVGRLIQGKLEDKGVRFHLGSTVTEFRGNGQLEEVVLENDESIAAGLAVIGIGVKPAADFFPEHVKAKDGSLLTDNFLQVEDDIFAAGDVATYPYWKTNEPIRIEHWRVAQQQGMIAAKNMMGANQKVEIIPFFWMNIAGMNLRYCGYAGNWNEIITDGNIASGDFINYYAENNHITAALGTNRDDQMAVIEVLLRAGKMPDAGLFKRKIIPHSELKELI